MLKIIKWIISLFKRKPQRQIIRVTENITMTLDNPKPLQRSNKYKERVTLQRNRYNLNSVGIWERFTQRKTVNVYGANRQEIEQETSRKQKLYEMGLL